MSAHDDLDRTPLWGYPDDPNDDCEDCGAPAGTACRLECSSGYGELRERPLQLAADRRSQP